MPQRASWRQLAAPLAGQRWVCRRGGRCLLEFACCLLNFFDGSGRPERAAPERYAEFLGSTRHDVQDLHGLWLKRFQTKTEASENQRKRDASPHGFR